MAIKTIKVKNCNNGCFEEYTATAVAITPGFLLELASATTVQAHSSSAGNVVPPMFALEDELQGNGITDAYAVSAKIQCWIPGRGDIVYALLANGQTASVGSFLESDGAGRLNVYAADVASSGEAQTIYPNPIVGVALEAVDMSDSSGADPTGRIKVRIL